MVVLIVVLVVVLFVLVGDATCCQCYELLDTILTEFETKKKNIIPSFAQNNNRNVNIPLRRLSTKLNHESNKIKVKLTLMTIELSVVGFIV